MYIHIYICISICIHIVQKELRLMPLKGEIMALSTGGRGGRKVDVPFLVPHMWFEVSCWGFGGFGV